MFNNVHVYICSCVDMREVDVLRWTPVLITCSVAPDRKTHDSTDHVEASVLNRAKPDNQSKPKFPVGGYDSGLREPRFSFVNPVVIANDLCPDLVLGPTLFGRVGNLYLR